MNDEPKVGDFVVITDGGSGWHYTLTGVVTRVTSADITIGLGYTLDLDSVDAIRVLR